MLFFGIYGYLRASYADMVSQLNLHRESGRMILWTSEPDSSFLLIHNCVEALLRIQAPPIHIIRM
jgi:hypothetical protein